MNRAGKETRTLDPFITSEVLYRLSYSSSKNYYTKIFIKLQELFSKRFNKKRTVPTELPVIVITGYFL